MNEPAEGWREKAAEAGRIVLFFVCACLALQVTVFVGLAMGRFTVYVCKLVGAW